MLHIWVKILLYLKIHSRTWLSNLNIHKLSFIINKYYNQYCSWSYKNLECWYYNQPFDWSYSTYLHITSLCWYIFYQLYWRYQKCWLTVSIFVYLLMFRLVLGDGYILKIYVDRWQMFIHICRHRQSSF